jgi:hypothetical protein
LQLLAPGSQLLLKCLQQGGSGVQGHGDTRANVCLGYPRGIADTTRCTWTLPTHPQLLLQHERPLICLVCQPRLVPYCLGQGVNAGHGGLQLQSNILRNVRP